MQVLLKDGRKNSVARMLKFNIKIIKIKLAVVNNNNKNNNNYNNNNNNNYNKNKNKNDICIYRCLYLNNNIVLINKII